MAIRDPNYLKGFEDGWRLSRSKIKTLLTDKVEEVKNDIGGVIGYTLNLDADETQELFKKLEE